MTELPKGWEVQPLSSLVENPKNDIVDGPFGSNLKRSDFNTSGVPVLKIQNIKPNGIQIKKMDYVSPLKAASLGRHNFVSGDVIMTKLGAPLGVSAIVGDDLPLGVIVADLVRIRPGKVNTKFLCYQLNSPRISKLINDSQKGTTRPRVNIQIVRNLPIAVPPIEEQNRIVETLDDHLSRLDKALTEVTSAFLKFETLERSAMALHFSTTEGFVNLTKILDATEKAKSIDPKILAGDSFMYVDISSISPDSETPNVTDWTSSASAPSRARQHIKSGDVVFSTVRPYQKKIAIVNEVLDGHIASTGFCVLRPVTGVLDTRYLYHYLKSDALMDQVLPLQRGASYPAVGDSDIKNATIPLPNLDVQRAIAEELDSVVGTVKTLKSQLQDVVLLADIMRRSILHAAFSGKLIEGN